ncbi:hypothetical protein QBC47DRAFT_403555 [Echria macrotheca]|uniref:Uncharacterized protein n=1 Tax=Echria macrotheca TaxID=438768 RepID=A0AAJ0FAE9_9PEZI|nr:hypothetical protein QBC47DRAFT_403555 [Echria macrotheca]
MSYSWNTSNEYTVVPEMEFPKTHTDVFNYKTEHLTLDNVDPLILGIDPTWDWSATMNPQGQAAVQDDVLFLTETQTCQEAAPNITDIVTELQHKTGELEQRMEDRINKVEERIVEIQNGLEDETARLCAEINDQIKLLKAWSAQIKKYIEKATHIQDLQDE